MKLGDMRLCSAQLSADPRAVLCIKHLCAVSSLKEHAVPAAVPHHAPRRLIRCSPSRVAPHILDLIQVCYYLPYVVVRTTQQHLSLFSDGLETGLRQPSNLRGCNGCLSR
ncbi:hypothetical protein RB213_008230 [Colletotrichum asianum]